jgi:hypothetical protein
MKSAMRVVEAGCHAGLSATAGVPRSGVSPHEAQAEAQRAMTALGRALADGYRDIDNLRTEAALDPLRARRDFQLLMMDVAMPDEPFAH